jgi:hypothetical protein
MNKIKSYPNVDQNACVDYADLQCMAKTQDLLDIKFNQAQKNFFNSYWSQQLPLKLNIPSEPMSLANLVDHWNCWNYFDQWFAAFSVVTYELINSLHEAQRCWSIDTVSWSGWQDVIACIDTPGKYLNV